MEFNEAQLTAARAKMWHQDGEALLTLESARAWVREMGLVLFAPRPQIVAPAASLVEATLGHANPAPSLAETEAARGFVARLVQSGEALPLHLLGEYGDVPDFVVSAQMFSFIFTLRGDKAWKQPPLATNISPLASKAYEELNDRGALTAAELAAGVGREVSESAVVRALVELWSQLRVIPVAQPDGSATRWELLSQRFLKAIKAGSNAGQPTALSAVTSVYLSQVVAATEEEIVTFLSPLTARSRVRDVVHALTSARQLDTVVVEGKTLLHVPGALPEIAPAIAVEAAESVEAPAIFDKPKKIGTGRIGKFAPGNKDAGEFRGKSLGKDERQRRPFSKGGVKPGARPNAAGKPSFTKPWDEQRKPRARTEGGAFQKFRKPEGAGSKPLGDREQAGLPPAKRVFSKPKFERESQARDAARKPGGASEGGADAGWKKPRSFAKKPFEKKPFEKKPFEKKPFEKRPFEKRPFGKKPFEKKTGGFGAKRPFKPREAEGSERREFKPRSFEKKPFGVKPFEKRSFDKKPFEKKLGGFVTKRPFKPRDEQGGEQREFKPRSFEKKPFEKKPFGKKPGGFGGGKKPDGFAPRRAKFTPVADNAERTMPKRPYKPRAADADQRKFTKAPWTPAEDAGTGPKRKSFGAKKFGPKKFGGFGGKRGPKPARKRDAEE